MRPDDLISHEIAASNILFGASRFLTLWLAPEWDLAPGVGRPEIIASHEINDIKWVSSGRAWYVIYNRETRWAMELRIDIGHPRQQKQLAVGVPMTVDGHEAIVRHWERGRGLLRRRRITYVEVAYNCSRTERWIRLELSGRCGDEGFHALLELLPYLRCH